MTTFEEVEGRLHAAAEATATLHESIATVQSAAERIAGTVQEGAADVEERITRLRRLVDSRAAVADRQAQEALAALRRLRASLLAHTQEVQGATEQALAELGQLLDHLGAADGDLAHRVDACEEVEGALREEAVRALDLAAAVEELEESLSEGTRQALQEIQTGFEGKLAELGEYLDGEVLPALQGLHDGLGGRTRVAGDHFGDRVSHAGQECRRVASAASQEAQGRLGSVLERSAGRARETEQTIDETARGCEDTGQVALAAKDLLQTGGEICNAGLETALGALNEIVRLLDRFD